MFLVIFDILWMVFMLIGSNTISFFLRTYYRKKEF